MDHIVVGFPGNDQNLQCTEIWKMKLGKRIYSHTAWKQECGFESRQGHTGAYQNAPFFIRI